MSHEDFWDRECVQCGHKWVDDGKTTCPECRREHTYSFHDLLIHAYEAHKGQVYLGYGSRMDEPYICHCIRVANRVPEDMIHQSVAILHDCAEDAGRLPGGLPSEIRNPIWYLTRNKDETYEEYIDRMMEEDADAKVARTVKLADLEDNMQNHPPPRLLSRYFTAYHKLKEN